MHNVVERFLMHRGTHVRLILAFLSILMITLVQISSAWAVSCTPVPVAGATGIFGDIGDSSFAKDAAEAMYERGITSGCQANPLMYCPNCSLSRRQAAIMIARAMGLAPLNPPTPTFQDVPPSMTGYGEIEALAAVNVFVGCAGSPRQFCPSRPLRRDEGVGRIR
ncbi:MAG: hypothetical protein ACNA8W_04380 [Bradymonadaceae bacterium]